MFSPRYSPWRWCSYCSSSLLCARSCRPHLHSPRPPRCLSTWSALATMAVHPHPLPHPGPACEAGRSAAQETPQRQRTMTDLRLRGAHGAARSSMHGKMGSMWISSLPACKLTKALFHVGFHGQHRHKPLGPLGSLACNRCAAEEQATWRRIRFPCELSNTRSTTRGDGHYYLNPYRLPLMLPQPLGLSTRHRTCASVETFM